MKPLTKYTLLTAMLISFGLAGCSSSTDSTDELETVTEEDLEIAAEVVSESISDQTGGTMNSVFDAVSDVSESGISYSNTQSKSQYSNEDAGRGRESNYSYSYDPETGTHTIDFLRSVTRGDFSKSVSAHLEYIFTDPEGTFIVQPRAHKDSIEAVDFKGTRSGEMSTIRGNSNFTRIDSLLLSGLHSSSAIFGFEGTHHGEGSRSGITRNEREFNRTYEVDIIFTDIQIDKAIVEANGDLTEGVTGSVSYTIVLTGSNGDQNREKTIEGTVEFLGDGTGLLRFERFAKVFRFSLSDGDVTEE